MLWLAVLISPYSPVGTPANDWSITYLNCAVASEEAQSHVFDLLAILSSDKPVISGAIVSSDSCSPEAEYVCSLFSCPGVPPSDELCSQVPLFFLSILFPSPSPPHSLK